MQALVSLKFNTYDTAITHPTANTNRNTANFSKAILLFSTYLMKTFVLGLNFPSFDVNLPPNLHLLHP